MERFTSLAEAQAFVTGEVDRPTSSREDTIGNGVKLVQSTIDLPGGTFTNSYDLTYKNPDVHPDIVAFDRLTSVCDFLTGPDAAHYQAASSGGFFFLADRASGLPRQLALNLSISRGALKSLPVRDQETVISGTGGLEVRPLVSLGSLSINGHDLDWSGSLTDYDTDVKVFSNGNAVITHVQDPITGFARTLEETSRYTPSILDDEHIDVGFVARGNNSFIGVEGSTEGGVDIFAHDFVVRCHQKYIEGNSELEVLSVGGIALSRFTGGAFSAGPALNIVDFQNHPINHDASLGSRPPFIETHLARSAVYKTSDGLHHIRLFDGRPGSPIFSGVTPSEAVTIIMDTDEIEWGCFLDPGQTARMGVISDDGIKSYGNRHYLKWPTAENSHFLWVPEIGRPNANVIAI